MIILNRIKCLNCEEVLTSEHVHDYNPCQCGDVAVDGGLDYLKRVGTNYLDKSIEIPDELWSELVELLVEPNRESLEALLIRLEEERG